MNQLAHPAPKVDAVVSVTSAPEVDAATATSAQVVEPATVERVKPVDPAGLFDPTMDAPRMKEVVKENSLSVRALRGSNGADFEAVVALLRGAPHKNFLKRMFPVCFDERDFVAFGEVKRYVVVKGNSCFVFTEETEIQPLYAIPLNDVRPVMEDPKKPDKFSVTISPTSAKTQNADLVTVLLKYQDGSHAYQFTFDTSKDRSLAKRFYDVVHKAAKSQKKVVTASVIRAEAVGEMAAEAQPSKELK
jgi:hypothetical protein